MAEVDWGHLSMIMIISLNLSLSFNSLAIFCAQCFVYCLLTI